MFRALKVLISAAGELFYGFLQLVLTRGAGGSVRCSRTSSPVRHLSRRPPVRPRPQRSERRGPVRIALREESRGIGAWLAKHYESETEIWLLYYKKHSGRPRIPYDDAVEEALCFGWIDSLVKRIDGDRFAQKFTPRRNREVVGAEHKEGPQADRGRPNVGGRADEDGSGGPRRKPGAATAQVGRRPSPFVKRALRASPKAWEHFQMLAPSYRRTYVRWISDAKREETRERRLREAVSRLEQNQKPRMI